MCPCFLRSSRGRIRIQFYVMGLYWECVLREFFKNFRQRVGMSLEKRFFAFRFQRILYFFPDGLDQ